MILGIGIEISRDPETLLMWHALTIIYRGGGYNTEMRCGYNTGIMCGYNTKHSKIFQIVRFLQKVIFAEGVL